MDIVLKIKANDGHFCQIVRANIVLFFDELTIFVRPYGDPQKKSA